MIVGVIRKEKLSKVFVESLPGMLWRLELLLADKDKEIVFKLPCVQEGWGVEYYRIPPCLRHHANEVEIWAVEAEFTTRNRSGATVICNASGQPLTAERYPLFTIAGLEVSAYFKISPGVPYAKVSVTKVRYPGKGRRRHELSIIKKRLVVKRGEIRWEWETIFRGVRGGTHGTEIDHFNRAIAAANRRITLKRRTLCFGRRGGRSKVA